VPQMTIYLATPLAGRVREANVNVSRICQQALEAELNRYDTAQECLSDDDLDSVAARLRASRDEVRERVWNQGHRRGTEWARSRATYGELHVVGELGSREWTTVATDLVEWPTLHDLLTNEFQLEAFRHELKSDKPWAQGFVQGATEVWQAVKDKL
jgi:hypothetical protein